MRDAPPREHGHAPTGATAAPARVGQGYSSMRRGVWSYVPASCCFAGTGVAGFHRFLQFRTPGLLGRRCPAEFIPINALATLDGIPHGPNLALATCKVTLPKVRLQLDSHTPPARAP